MKHSIHWLNSFCEARTALEKFLENLDYNHLEQLTTLCVHTIKNNGTIFIAGNGGSHADALHFAEELTGKFRNDRNPVGAISLGEATHLTCSSNDFGFEYALSRQFQALSKSSNDLLIILSTSGNSQNLVQLANRANNMERATYALLGKDGGKLKELVTLFDIVPGKTSDRIQELHMLILHTLVETIERELFPENYKENN